MIETISQTLDIVLEPRFLDENIDEHIFQEIRNRYEGKSLQPLQGIHTFKKASIITKIVSIQSIKTIKIHPETGCCFLKILFSCEQCTVSEEEILTLPIHLSNKHGLYFQYGLFEIFITDPLEYHTQSKDDTMNRLEKIHQVGEEIKLKIVSITFPGEKYAVIAEMN